MGNHFCGCALVKNKSSMAAWREFLLLLLIAGALAQDSNGNQNGNQNGNNEEVSDGDWEPPAQEGGDLSYQEVEYEVEGSTGLPAGFVEQNGDRFEINGCDFTFAGFNLWQALELATNTKVNRGNPLPGREHLTNIFNEAVDAGLYVIRMWAHTIVKGRALQPEPGEYEEEFFQGLDWINDQCAQRGLKIIWIFADNWYNVGGVEQYEEWAGDFYGEEAKRLYKDNMKAIINRENSINGVVYKDDETIMAWNLINEIRCKKCPTETVTEWIEEMCDFVRSQDPNHIIGVGEEGFYGPDSGETEHNPAKWAQDEGQDFVSNHESDCIGYVGIHIWPDNWKLLTVEFQTDFIQAAIDNTDKYLNKPFILEEFGKKYDGKELWLKNAYNLAEESAAEGGPLRGTLFYHWYDEGIGPGSYGIQRSMPIFDEIIRHAKAMNAISTC